MPKRILLTGGSGMVGRNIQEHPLARRFEFSAPSHQELNLTKFSAVVEYLQAMRPVAIIHTAGRVGGIQANVKAPVDFMIANLDMGRNIVLAAKEADVRQLLNFGSSCMYPRNAANPLYEEQILQGELEPTNEGYALAKIVTARLCQYVAKQDYRYSYKTLIPCNLFGRYDKFSPETSHLIPAIIHKIHRAKMIGNGTVEIWGDGEARREFMYAGDLADAVMRAIDSYDQLPDLMNLGVGQDHTINDYYAITARVIGWRGEFVHDLKQPVGMNQKLLAIDRQLKWGWRSMTSLEDAIADAYSHYLKTIT